MDGWCASSRLQSWAIDWLGILNFSFSSWRHLGSYKPLDGGVVVAVRKMHDC